MSANRPASSQENSHTRKGEGNFSGCSARLQVSRPRVHVIPAGISPRQSSFGEFITQPHILLHWKRSDGQGPRENGGQSFITFSFQWVSSAVRCFFGTYGTWLKDLRPCNNRNKQEILCQLTTQMEKFTS
jgi:hypothetical protein